jgi:hypothetical protein
MTDLHDDVSVPTDEEDTADSLRRIDGALSELIQDDGAIEARVKSFEYDLFGLTSSDGFEAGFAKHKLVEALECLEIGRSKTALTWALGLGSGQDPVPSLRLRRQQTRDHLHVDVSDDTLRRWERSAIQALCPRIYTERAQLRRRDVRAEYLAWTQRSSDPSIQAQGVASQTADLLKSQEAMIVKLSDSLMLTGIALRDLLSLLRDQLPGDAYEAMQKKVFDARFIGGHSRVWLNLPEDFKP